MCNKVQLFAFPNCMYRNQMCVKMNTVDVSKHSFANLIPQMDPKAVNSNRSSLAVESPGEASLSVREGYVA